MVVGRKIWERTDIVEAANPVRRERTRIGEANAVRGGNKSPSSMFLVPCGPNACQSDQAGTQAHAINSCMG